MSRLTWTPDIVKHVLPNVPVEFRLRNGEAIILNGTVLGRKLERAKVRANGQLFECTWEAVAECLNSGRPLVA